MRNVAGERNINKQTNRTSRQTPADIAYNTPAYRGGHVQNRIRRRQALRGKFEPGP